MHQMKHETRSVSSRAVSSALQILERTTPEQRLLCLFLVRYNIDINLQLPELNGWIARQIERL